MAKLKFTASLKRVLFDEVAQFLKEEIDECDNGVVLGIDLSSSSTGYVVLKGGELVDTGVFGQNSFDGTYIERDAYMYEEFLGLLKEHDPGIVCIEQVSVFRDPHAVKMLIEVQAALHLAIAHTVGTKSLFLDVTTTQIKKIGAGSSKADKSNMLKEVYKRYDVDFDDDNQADAYCAALVGANLKQFLDRYHQLREENYDPGKKKFDRFLMNFTKYRHHDPELDVMPIELYEVIIGLMISTGMRPLKNNSADHYHSVREILWQEKGK